MKGYAVHLLCHLLAVICGAALGAAGTIWWIAGIRPALWMAVAALVLGIVVLVVQWRVLAAQPVGEPPRRSPSGTRPQLRPTDEVAGGGTRVSPQTRRF